MAAIPEDVRNYSHPSAQNDFLKAIEVGDAETVRSLLNMGGLSPMFIDVGFRRAAEYSTADVVRVFIESGRLKDINAFNGIALTLAVGAGKLENVHVLLAGGADPSVNDNRSLQLAIEGAHVEIVRALMEDPRVDPRVPEWRPFISILEAPANRVELLRLFLADRRVDPTQGNNWMQQTLQANLQTPGLSSERKSEIEEMLNLLRTGSRSLRVAAMTQQQAGRRTRRRVKKMRRRRGTRRY
jgi:hypothetical protein